MKIVAFIPLRGGSKGIPGKNIKSFCGQPLAYWATKAAVDSIKIDDVFIATDSDNIKSTMLKLFQKDISVIGRGANTATDEASTESAMLEFAEAHEFDHIVLIQATNPLITAEDLNRGIEKYIRGGYDSLLSVVMQKRFIWEEKDNLAKAMNYIPSERPRRQEMEGFFVENGAFYITNRENLLRTKCRLSGKIGLYEMNEKTYFEIDEPSDWIIMEGLFSNTF